MTSPVDAEAPLERVVVVAGQNASLPCPGISSADSSASGGFMINQLAWTCAGKRTCPAADDEVSDVICVDCVICFAYRLDSTQHTAR